MLQPVREREDVREKDRMGRGVERNVWRLDRQQDAAILVSAPVEMTCEVQRGGAEMCSLVRLPPAVVSSASRRQQSSEPSERSLGTK